MKQGAVLFCFVLFICFIAPKPVEAGVPAEGLYITIRNDVVASAVEQISLKIADLANADNSFPPYNGQSGSAKYSFYNFAFDVSLQGFNFLPANPPGIVFGWNTFDFIFQFQFHICDTNFPFPCDDGYITIFTTNNIKIQVNGVLGLSGPTISYSSSGVALVFNQGDIIIDVDCTSTFCLIPVSDISNAVAQNFVPVFQTGMQQFIDQSASEYLNQISTTIPLTELQLDLILNGGFAFYPPNAVIPNIVFFLDGLFVPDNQTSKRPPFNPTVAPPDSVFLNPATQMDIVLTPYIFETAIWALGLQGEFNRKITNQDIPANSPVHLTTNDEFFLQAAPGLAKYPNMNITITTALINNPDVTISTSGILVDMQIQATFQLNNKTMVLPGFQLVVDLSITLTPATNQSANGTINFYATLANLKNTVTVSKTNVGTIDTSIFQSVIMLLVSFFPPKIPSFSVSIVYPYIVVSSPVLTLNAGNYLELGAALKITYPVPDVQCSSTFACPISTTCCNWSSGWGCCTLPSANCCPGAGCCPNGWACVSGGCEQEMPNGNIVTIANNTRWTPLNHRLTFP